MRSLNVSALKQALPSSAIALALLALIGSAVPAMANTYTLCANAAGQGGFGDTFTAVAGPLDGTCGTNSAVDMSIATETDYARLLWDSSVTNYPPDLTLGNLGGMNADIGSFTPGQAGDQPYFMLVFTDATQGLGQAAATDQILMLEFQNTTLSGTNLPFDPNTTLVNLYDNTTGTYLAGGQADAQTLDSWLSSDSFLAGESLQQVRLAIGLSGGGSSPESITVNSLDITTTSAVPEPTSLPLLLILVAALGWGIHRGRRRCLKI